MRDARTKQVSERTLNERTSEPGWLASTVAVAAAAWQKPPLLSLFKLKLELEQRHQSCGQAKPAQVGSGRGLVRPIYLYLYQRLSLVWLSPFSSTLTPLLLLSSFIRSFVQ